VERRRRGIFGGILNWCGGTRSGGAARAGASSGVLASLARTCLPHCGCVLRTHMARRIARIAAT